jgi:hypothetical protein
MRADRDDWWNGMISRESEQLAEGDRMKALSEPPLGGRASKSGRGA